MRPKKWKIYDSVGRLVREFDSRLAAEGYRRIFGNYGWNIK